jgi:DNA processing protein
MPYGAIASALGPRQSERGPDARRGVVPQQAWADVQRPGQHILCWQDEEFPAPLRLIPDPPAVLYVRGKLPAWERTVGIVGARQASPYGQRVARGLGRDLAALGAVVVSGVAAGIDAQAHHGALEASGLTVGVLGCGHDHVYPAGHGRLYAAISSSGALITEHAPDERPTKYSFPRRNRLISGLSQGVVIVEATAKSGSLITADFALEQGKTVFAVPGPIDAPGSEGPHILITSGARLVAGVNDVIEELGWQVERKAKRTSDNPLEQQVLLLLGHSAMDFDDLATRVGLTAASAGHLLMTMELKGLVRRLAAQRYELG